MATFTIPSNQFDKKANRRFGRPLYLKDLIPYTESVGSGGHPTVRINLGHKYPHSIATNQTNPHVVGRFLEKHVTQVTRSFAVTEWQDPFISPQGRGHCAGPTAVLSSVFWASDRRATI